MSLYSSCPALPRKKWFQPISYRWANNLKPYNAEEPKRFVGYYESMALGSAVRIAQAIRLLQ